MNVKPWLPSLTTLLNGSRFVAARPTSVAGRAWAPWQHAHPPARSSVDVRLSGAKATELWSSPVTRAIHLVEEFTILLIMVHFAVGILAVLFGW